MVKIEAIGQAEFCFDRRYFFFCMHSALSQLLHFYRVENADLMIEAGWNCRLEGDGRLRLDLEPLIAWRRGRYSIRSCREESEYELLWERNTRSVEQGRPVILGADYYELPFHPRYHKQHGAHAVLLYGFDRVRSTALVADYNSPFVAYRGEISMTALRRARASANAWNGSINSGGIQAACLELLEDPSDWHGSERDVGETLRGLERDYFHPDGGPGVRGMDAVRHLCSELHRTAPAELPRRALWLHEQLLPLNEKKRMLERYLEDAAMLLHASLGVERAVELLREINELWTTYAKVLLKIAYTPHKTGPLERDARGLSAQAMEREARLAAVIGPLGEVLEP